MAGQKPVEKRGSRSRYSNNKQWVVYGNLKLYSKQYLHAWVIEKDIDRKKES